MTKMSATVRAIGAEKEGIFPCPESGCQMIFEKFGDLETHLDVETTLQESWNGIHL